MMLKKKLSWPRIAPTREKARTSAASIRDAQARWGH